MHYRSFLFLLSIFSASLAAAQLSTIAGAGIGDHYPAASVLLNHPAGIVADGLGNVYFSDTFHNTVRKIDANGMITTVAGRPGVYCREGLCPAECGGDGARAVDACLGSPRGLAYRQGELYIADSDRGRVFVVRNGLFMNTVAGGGETLGDGSAAIAAALKWPRDVALDAAGNLYIADWGQHRIRKVDNAGNISTVAGSGEENCDPFGICRSAFSGDGGPATMAQLNYPEGVAVDAAGNLYIADTRNQRVRKVDGAGIITTMAGDGSTDCYWYRAVICFGRYGGDGGPATAAQLARPTDVVVDAHGALYIADSNNQRIRRVGVDGIISSVAGDGLEYDSQGNTPCAQDQPPYLCYGAFGGDGGPAMAAQLSVPLALTLDNADNLYIADSDNHRIRQVDARGMMTTVAGGGRGRTPGREWVDSGTYGGDGAPGRAAYLNRPIGLAADANGNLYIADAGNHAVRKVDRRGLIETVAGGNGMGFSGDGGAARAAQLDSPGSVAVDAAGNLYIADTLNHRIRKVDTAGIISTLVGYRGPTLSQEQSECGGAPLTVTQSLDELIFPRGVAIDTAGNVYFSAFSHGGIGGESAACSFWNLVEFGTLHRLSPSGELTQLAAETSFGQLGGIALDTAGNVYFADHGVVYRLDPQDTLTPIAGGGEHPIAEGLVATEIALSDPHGVAVDAVGGVYIADRGESRVLQVDPDGILHILAGNGSQSNAEEGVDALQTGMNQPYGVAVGANGRIYIAETYANRVHVLRDTPEPARIINLSTRASVEQDSAQWMTAGFYMRGSGSKRLFIPGLGRGLRTLGVPTDLDPRLEIREQEHGTVLFDNLNWGEHPSAAEIIASPFNLPDPTDAGMIIDLAAGPYLRSPFLAVLAPEGVPGIGIIGVEDLDDPDTATAWLTHISTRAPVGTTPDTWMTAGFMLQGPGVHRVFVRALGQSLRTLGIDTALEPRLELRTRDGVVIARNDNWDEGPSAVEIINRRLYLQDPSDAGLILDLAAGAYLVVVIPNGTGGIGIVGVDLLE